MSDLLEENEPCKHLDLEQREEQTKIFKVEGNKREIFLTRTATYFYCKGCKSYLNMIIQDNKVNKN